MITLTLARRCDSFERMYNIELLFSNSILYLLTKTSCAFHHIPKVGKDRHGRDHMVVEFITIYEIRDYHQRLSVTHGMLVVSPGTPVSSTNKLTATI